jgi:hypothetical protein
VEENVDRAPEKRKKQDKENPGELIGGFFVLVQNIDANNDAYPPEKVV